MDDPARDVQPLAHAARVALDALLLASGEADELEHLVDPLALPAAGHAVELGEVAQVVVGREPLVEPAVAAEDVADPLAHLVRVPNDVEPEHPRLTARRQEQRDQHLDRRRLAGPVRPEQPEELALADLERDPAHRLDLERAPPDDPGVRLVGAPQVADFDDACHPARLTAGWSHAVCGSPSQQPSFHLHLGHCQVECRHSISALQRQHFSTSDIGVSLGREADD